MDIIKLIQVSKAYGNKKVLYSTDFNFEKGSFYVLGGESGCGKTTLLNIIAGYIEPDSGKIIRNAKVEYLFQDEMLFSNLTVEENMKIHLYASRAISPNDESDILSVLETLKISKLMKQKISSLSGGERQRVELASILLTQPDVILLDEPTAKLDRENKDNLLNVISSVFREKTLIVVTHETSIFPEEFIRLKLENGRLLHEGK